MNQTDRLERDLTAWFVETAAPRTPDFLDDILAQTAGANQRAAWTFPERWLPMSVTTLGRRTLAPVPWRTLGIVAVIALLTLATLAVVIGSQRRVPAPFGPAGNGLVAVEQAGDIVVLDPTTGSPRILIGGPTFDTNPRFSRDGTRIAFFRETGSALQLAMADADGRNVRVLDTGPMSETGNIDWAPDGRTILLSTTDPGGSAPTDHAQAVWIIPVDGGPGRALSLGMAATSAAWRPPEGRQFLFLGVVGTTHGLYVADADGTNVGTIVSPNPALDIGYASWAPDGSTIGYTEWDTTADVATARQRFVSHDGTDNRMIELDPGATWGLGTWSNDNERVFITGIPKAGHEGTFYAIVIRRDTPTVGPMNLAAPPVGAYIFGGSWSPDDTSFVGTTHDADDRPLTQMLWDTTTGKVAPAPWSPISSDWQRIAR